MLAAGARGGILEDEGSDCDRLLILAVNRVSFGVVVGEFVPVRGHFEFGHIMGFDIIKLQALVAPFARKSASSIAF